jgi:NADH dehydrogenase FAD-containing subunit
MLSARTGLPHEVIVGAGFGGRATAKAIAGSEVPVKWVWLR